MVKSAVAFLVALAVAVAAGCGGSDDESPKGGGGAPARPATKTSAAPATPSKKAAAPKRATTRGKMVTCLRGAGFTVKAEGGDEATATNYTVTDGDAGSRTAVIVIRSNENDALGAARRAGEDKGLNAVAFGRAEFIRYKATDTEAGVIANCVAENYLH